MMLGYAVAEPPRLLHFVFVDRDMRKRAGGRLPSSVGLDLVSALLPVFGRKEVSVTLDLSEFASTAKRFKLRFDPQAVPVVGYEFSRWLRAWRESLEGVR
jgi:hypothetical protein